MSIRIFSGLEEGQVLQRRGKRGADARVTGSTTAAGVVYASIQKAGGPLRGWKRRRVGLAVEGAFEARLAGIPAGGPYRLTLECGSARLRARTFYVGDVWLLAGQSNMEGCGHMALGKAKPHPLVRAFSLRREWRRAEDPLHVPWESPDKAVHGGDPAFTREQAEEYRRTTRVGVGVGIFFAREMLARSGVPQGLLCTARGATQMAQWCPDPKNPEAGALYQAMLRSVRVTGQPVAGVLWYQGEGDSAADRSAIYTSRMERLIAETRRELGQPKLPWIIGQLSRVYGKRKETAWNSVQEQQRALAAGVENAALVATIDLPLDDFIHLGAEAFPRLANRFARAADRLVYGNRREAPPPALQAVSPLQKDSTGKSGWIDVTFVHAVGGLHATGLPLGFVVLDAEGRPLPALFKTTLHGSTARLHVVPEFFAADLRVAYGHGNAPACNIVDRRDCALPVFTSHKPGTETKRRR